jgi:hypothetical protein
MRVPCRFGKPIGMTSIRLKDLLDTLPGSLSETEALSLFRAARHTRGAVVNAGPCNDKAAIALVVGLASHPPGRRQKYYCIEPEPPRANGAHHRGGTRRSLVENLATMGCESLADLMITPDSGELASWREPIGLLRLQSADYTSMRAEVDKWLPFLDTDGSILIQGPMTDKAARRQLISELESDGGFIRFEDIPGVVELRRSEALRKPAIAAGSSAPEVVRQYALAHGYDEASLNARLAHSSFVSARHRYIYIEIPKAACTTMKYFIAALENASCQLERMPYLRETKPNMLIHQRQFVVVPTVLDLNGREVEALFAGESDYFVFALVRNPYSRLVSAFESKIRLGEPGLREVTGRRWAAASEGADVREAFASFVRSDLEVLVSNALEHHFVSQHRLLMRPLIPYTKIFQVERFKEFEADLIAHLKRRGAQAIPEFKDWNRSLYPDWRYYYDRQTAERVQDFFEADFEGYGYDPESWRTDEQSPDMRTSAMEAFWRMEVIERNDMIEFLYGLLRNAN